MSFVKLQNEYPTLGELELDDATGLSECRSIMYRPFLWQDCMWTL